MKVVLLLFILIVGCNEKEENNILESNAVLRWTGSYAVDGCGYFIDIGEKEYKPENETDIPEHFNTSENANVFIEYTYTDEQVAYSCGFTGTASMDGIFIHKIE